MNTNSWSDSIEKAVSEIKENCHKNKWKSIASARKNTRCYDTMMYIIIFVGPISGILSALSVYDFEDKHILDIVIMILSFFSGVMTTIIKFAKFDQKSAGYRTLATKYASLEGNISRQLTLERKDRINAREYLEWVSKSYDTLFISMTLFIEEKKKEDETNLNSPKTKTLPSSEIKTEKVIDQAMTAIDLTTFSDNNMKYELARLNNN